MTRTFEARVAVRERVPLLIGLVGASGSGKTFSALRLASGIASVDRGSIFVLDTEARRALAYARDPKTGKGFDFTHVPMGAPFSPLDYLEAIRFCVEKGAGTIVIDSMSHEHEGPGGVLEEHDAETKRLAALWKVKESVASMAAWSAPKSKRRALINAVLQLNVNLVLCFRAKRKLEIKKGQDPRERGWQPIAGDEWIYEMAMQCLLLPGCDGCPTWKGETHDEQAIIKVPEQFRSIVGKDGQQLSEEIGRQLATWAAGAAAPERLSADELVLRYETCTDDAGIRVIDGSRAVVWASLSKDEKTRVKAAFDAAKKRLADAASVPTPTPASGAPSDEERAAIEAAEREAAAREAAERGDAA